MVDSAMDTLIEIVIPVIGSLLTSLILYIAYVVTNINRKIDKHDRALFGEDGDLNRLIQLKMAVLHLTNILSREEIANQDDINCISECMKEW